VDRLPWRVLARAEVTKQLAHGDRYLETRVFLADGRIMEQVNPGVADLENDWREIGRFSDLRTSLRDLRKGGWHIDHPERPFGLIGLPALWSTDPFRAWIVGLGGALATWSLLALPLGIGLALVPLLIGALAVYALTVRPRVSAASGVLLGTAPFLAWGVIDGLRRCARFNASPGGGCEADPSAQVAITVIVYALAVLATGVVVWRARPR
jgi:hypothetical protein